MLMHPQLLHCGTKGQNSRPSARSHSYFVLKEAPAEAVPRNSTDPVQGIAAGLQTSGGEINEGDVGEISGSGERSGDGQDGGQTAETKTA